MLSRKSKYGLKALLTLARERSRGPILISDLAQRDAIPKKFLEAILLAAVPCVSQTAYMKCAECVDETTCGVRAAMKEVRDATAKILDNTTLADINARLNL